MLIYGDSSAGTKAVQTDSDGVLRTNNDGTGIHVAATPTAATAVAADVNALVAAVAGLRLVGFSVKETAGAAAVLNIVHGATAAGGANIFPITLAADESTSDWFGPDGIAVASGLSIDWVSGAALIVLMTKVVA